MRTQIETALVLLDSIVKLVQMEDKCVTEAIATIFRSTTCYPKEAMMVERDFYALTKELKNLQHSLTKLKEIQ